ncbi:hypothetical protein [Bacillus salipaludis]|nr:hypothetical protein [Bacillus salipaludis]
MLDKNIYREEYDFRFHRTIEKGRFFSLLKKDPTSDGSAPLVVPNG